MKVYSKLTLAIEGKKNGIILAKDYEYDNRIIKQYCVFKDNKEVVSTLTKKNTIKTWYEVFLLNSKCHFVIDEDIKDTEGRTDPKKRIENDIKTIKSHLIEYCSLQNKKITEDDINDVILQSPSTDKKDSFHIIFRIDGVYFNDILGCKNFYDYMTISKKENFLSIDKSLYSKNHCFRTVYSSKLEFPENTLKPIVEDTEILDTFGTYVEEKETDYILSNVVIQKPKKKKEVFVCSNNTVINDDTELIKQLINCLSIDRLTNQKDCDNLGILLNCLSRKDNIDYFNLWIEAEKKSHKWEPENSVQYFKDKWEIFDNYDIKYNIGTLYYWAKTDNLDLYNNFFLKKSYLDSALNGSHVDVSKAFQKRFGQKFIRNEEDKQWYEFNEKTGIWFQLPASKKSLYIAISVLSQEFSNYGKEFNKENGIEVSDSLKSELCDAIFNKLKNVPYVAQIISTLEWMMEEKSCSFNNNPYLFPFLNGVWDLKENKFRSGYFEEYITLNCGYNYKKEDIKLAEAFISDIFPDNSLFEYMLKVFSGALEGINKREEFFIWFNRRASNGKSTLSSLLQAVFGYFFHQGRQEALLQKKSLGSGENATPGLMACKNKRYIAYPEISNQHDLDSNILKLLTGNETISGRVLYGNEDKITIQARQSMGCNDIPNLSSIDGGIVRRLRIIKFETVFTLNPIKPHEKLIKDYDKEKLKFSFLNLLLKWYPIYSSNYFIPECVKTYTDDYLKETDSIRTFCEDHIIKCDKGDSFIKKNDLKALFQTEKNNYSLGKNEQQFCKKVLNHLDIDEFKRSKKIKGKIYHDVITGYKWIAEDEENLIEDEFE